MIKKLDPRVAWLVGALAVVCMLPSSKTPTTAQSVISDPNPRNALWNGAGPPSVPGGEDGDFYIDTSAPKSIYGPRTASAWPGPTSLVGPAGPTGATGGSGTNGTNGTNGAAATLAVGTVSSLPAGSTPIVVNAGTSLAAVLNFGLTVGNTGAAGATGPAGPSTVSYPNSRSLSLATAYQATDNTKPAIVTINLTSAASLSLSGGTTNTADVVLGSTNGVAGGTGTTICKYANTNTGALTIGLALNTVMGSTCTFALPAGGYFAVRQTAGTVTITSAFDQSVG